MCQERLVSVNGSKSKRTQGQGLQSTADDPIRLGEGIVEVPRMP